MGVRGQEAAGSSACELFRSLCTHDRIAWLPPQSTGDGSGLKVRERTLTLPQGTVMAYKRKQLVFRENGRGEQA